MGCALCVAGIGGGLFLARRFGLDEAVVSIWLSALNTAVAFFLAGLVKKNEVFRYLLSAVFYLITIIYLFLTYQINSRVFFGVSVGVLAYVLSFLVEKEIYLRNGRKSVIPFQKTIIPLVFLFAASLFAAVKVF